MLFRSCFWAVSGEEINPKEWRREIDLLTAQKQVDSIDMKAMREELKAVERLRKAADQLARQARDKPRDRGRSGKGYGALPTPLGVSRFMTPLCTELSTFTHGRRLPYEADYFTRHCPPEYPPAPCPLAAGTGRRAHRPGAGGSCLPGLRQLRRVWEVPA